MKSPTSIKITLWTLAAGLLVSLSGCNTVDPDQYQSVKMPPSMRYQAGSNHGSASQYALAAVPAGSTFSGVSSAAAGQTITRGRVLTELRSLGIRARFNVADNQYVIPDDAWLKQQYDPYFRWFLHYLSADYQAEGMDCDNFSNMYQQNLVLANLKSGGSRAGEVPCAVMIVNQRDKGILHALNLVRTDRGWFVVEPQDGRFTPLTSYRYRHDIATIDF